VNIRIYFIFLETRIIGYILPLMVSIYLHWNLFWCAPKNYFISARVMFPPFKVT